MTTVSLHRRLRIVGERRQPLVFLYYGTHVIAITHASPMLLFYFS